MGGGALRGRFGLRAWTASVWRILGDLGLFGEAIRRSVRQSNSQNVRWGPSGSPPLAPNPQKVSSFHGGWPTVNERARLRKELDDGMISLSTGLYIYTLPHPPSCPPPLYTITHSAGHPPRCLPSLTILLSYFPTLTVHLPPIQPPTQLDTLPAYLPLPSYFPTFLLLLSTSSLYYHPLSWTPSPRNVNCDSFDSNSDNAAF
jgi:hypothetical protein